MKILSVVGIENDHLVLVSEDGERFHVPLSGALTNALRRPIPPSPGARRVSPRDIQAHIRRGLSAQQVADLTGESVDYIVKFEGAVVAERTFIADQALSVPVSTRAGGETTFGQSVRSRLAAIAAVEEGWSAWKEESGWHLELVFHEGELEHRARWSFEPRKHLLEPLNDDAVVLSRHEPMPTTLIPTLSAVAEEEEPDRFDSQIFDNSDLGATAPLLEPVSYGRSSQDESRMADTADLLEVLRKKRGEREAASDGFDEPSRNTHPSTGGIRLVDDEDDEAEEDHQAFITPIGLKRPPDDDDDPTPPPVGKKKRPEMPSWDDIVFGARSDDDPA